MTDDRAIDRSAAATAATSMARSHAIVPLREVGAHALRPLLVHETACWIQRLGWDYRPTADLIVRSVASRAVTGFALHREGNLLAYAYALPSHDRSLIGSAHALPEAEPEQAACLVIDRSLDYLVNSVGARRVESQFIYFGSERIGTVFAAWEARCWERLYMRGPLATIAERLGPADDGTDPIRRLEVRDLATVAEIVYAGFVGSADAAMSECYATRQGCAGFVEGVVLRAGCGVHEPDASLVFERGGRCSGVVLMSQVGDGVAHVVQVSVRPEEHGRGLGRSLLRSACHRLRACGYHELTLSVSVDNQRALSWYRRLGLEAVQPFQAWVWERR